MTNAAIAITNASVTPILKSKNGEVVQEGTGTFFQIGQHKLMVTASHVLEEILKGSWIPYLLDAGNEQEQIIEAQLLGRSELCGEPFDVAITLLDTRTTDRLANRRYLSFNAVDVATIFPGAFCIGGFPAALGISGVASGPICGCMICTKLYTGSTATFSGVDARWHILIDRMEETGCTNTEGKAVGLPDSLGGASGSPLFQTYKDGVPFNEWDPSQIRVVGVATGEWREAKKQLKQRVGPPFWDVHITFFQNYATT
jgi:hypothetical protein